MKKSITENLKQILLIVFSVVLGLFLNEKIEEAKNRKEANKLLSKIKLEVLENKKLVEYWAPYHKDATTKIDSVYNDDKFIKSFIQNKLILFKTVFTRQTILGRFPNNDAWDIAKSHPLIVNLDYDQLLVLSKIYNQQKSTFKPIAKVSELILSIDFNSPENAKLNIEKLRNYMNEISSRELLLLEYYNEADKILNLQNIK